MPKFSIISPVGLRFACCSVGLITGLTSPTTSCRSHIIATPETTPTSVDGDQVRRRYLACIIFPPSRYKSPIFSTLPIGQEYRRQPISLRGMDISHAFSHQFTPVFTPIFPKFHAHRRMARFSLFHHSHGPRMPISRPHMHFPTPY